jgi:hypothetical protein
MSSPTSVWSRTFQSLRSRNFRLFFVVLTRRSNASAPAIAARGWSFRLPTRGLPGQVQAHQSRHFGSGWQASRSLVIVATGDDGRASFVARAIASPCPLEQRNVQTRLAIE